MHWSWICKSLHITEIVSQRTSLPCQRSSEPVWIPTYAHTVACSVSGLRGTTARGCGVLLSTQEAKQDAVMCGIDAIVDEQAAVSHSQLCLLVNLTSVGHRCAARGCHRQ